MWAAWLGGQYANGEADDLYHQQVFPVAPLDETFKQLAEAVYAPLQQNLMEVKL
jgi:hypothetical protein